MITCPVCLSSKHISSANLPLFSKIFKNNMDIPDVVNIKLCTCDSCCHLFISGLTDSEVQSLYSFEPSMSNIQPINKNYQPSKLSRYLKDNVKQNTFFIEYGSGSNSLVYELSEIFDFGISVDPSPYLNSLELPSNITKFVCYQENVPSVPNCYDLIIANNFLEHLPKPNLFFKRVSLELKSTGIFFVSVPYLSFILNKNAWMDIHIRHMQYFSFQSLVSLASYFNLHPIDVYLSEDERDINFLFAKNGYAGITNTFDEELLYKDLANRLDFLRNLQMNMSSRLSNLDEPLILYSATDIALLPINCLPNIILTVDDNPDHIGNYINSRNLKDPISRPDLIQMYPDIPILITAYNHTKTICTKIRKMKAKNILLSGNPENFMEQI